MKPWWRGLITFCVGELQFDFGINEACLYHHHPKTYSQWQKQETFKLWPAFHMVNRISCYDQSHVYRPSPQSGISKPKNNPLSRSRVSPAPATISSDTSHQIGTFNKHHYNSLVFLNTIVSIFIQMKYLYNAKCKSKQKGDDLIGPSDI